MRVAIIHFTVPPVAGGVESVIREHVRLLSRAGHEVTVIGGRGRRLQEPGVRFVRLPLLAATHPTNRRMAARLAQGEVPRDFDVFKDQILLDLQPLLIDQDAVLAHNALTLHFNLGLTASLVELGGGLLRDRLAAWTHDIAAINPLYRSELYDGPPWSLGANPQPGIRYVAISRERKCELRELWRRRGIRSAPEIAVIPNGIDPVTVLDIPRRLACVTRKLRLLERQLVVLLPVRITRRKNIEGAISILREIRRLGTDATLLVTGPSRGHHPARSRDYLAELRALVAGLHLDDDVVFLADDLGRPLTASELAGLYRLSDILLLPSRSEGFGLPVLEAAVHRLPVVASDLPILREVTGDQANYFDPDGPPLETARMVLDVASRGPGGLRVKVLRDYAWDSIYDNDIEPLLQRLKSGGKS